MIALRFEDFHEQNYEDKDFCLYVMKNGLGDVLYVGISMQDIWLRWFAWGGHYDLGWKNNPRRVADW